MLKFAGECLEVTLETPAEMRGRAFVRTNLQNASVRRREIIAATDADEPILARDWHDIGMHAVKGRPGRYVLRLPLTEVGFFSCKACILPEGETTPLWPSGPDTLVKVEPAHTLCANTVYTAFVRQFGKALTEDPHSPRNRELSDVLSAQDFTVIPPSGTFRDLIAKLDMILGTMRFRILQLLPVHPTPTTYARMGTFGSPFAARDLMDVDPALAEFDTSATPMDQFRELVSAVHAHGARIFLDMPANHTGWASTLQEHHPEWFAKLENGAFKSPGAWGVTWADLVELDYTHRELRTFMADVFLFWCRQGVDGFRCDAGYMIPQPIWTYITARVREAYPDTVFLLEGLGGKLETTEQLLSAANLDWAYSEIFQTENRGDFEAYLPHAISLAQRTGPLIHYAETHDNARLAQRGGPAYARLRTTLAALFSHHGAFGVTNGVEWFATEQINVHNARPLNWGAADNQVALIRHLNTLLATHPAFAQNVTLRLIHNGPGNVLALLRDAGERSLLVLVNLDTQNAQSVSWSAHDFPPSQQLMDLLSLQPAPLSQATKDLLPAQMFCLSARATDIRDLASALDAPTDNPPAILRLRKNLLALRVRDVLAPRAEELTANPDALGDALARDPVAYCIQCGAQKRGAFPPLAPVVFWDFPADTRREVMIAPGQLLLLRAPHPFQARLMHHKKIIAADLSIPLDNGLHATLLAARNDTPDHLPLTLDLHLFADGKIHHNLSSTLVLADPKNIRVNTTFTGAALRSTHPNLSTILANQCGTMAQIPVAWGDIHSQYNCLLGLNLDPRVPVDKTIFFTRCRLWLRRNGYSAAIDKDCLKSFTADPSGKFAQWRFDVPCGMGAWLPLTLTLSLAPLHNRLHLAVSAGELQGHVTDSTEAFRIIFRPDIEWRSFHTATKAYAGPERDFSRAVACQPNGFIFAPDASHPCAMFLNGPNAAFHADTEWCYQIFHPVEAQRGLEPHADLFSPGWFHTDLKPGETACLIAGLRDAADAPPPAAPPKNSTAPLTLANALKRALPLYIVNRDAFKTIIAGYPWFLDWGRDTLIVLRGLIAAGQTDDALAILHEFARFEERGTLPNIIHGNTVGNRDTSDAPLWFIIAVRDLVAATSARILKTDCGGRPLLSILSAILAGYRDGTPNGIQMDPASGLIFSPAHFTWMDTNHPAATPRCGYPVEIQALWIAGLDFVAQHDKKGEWATLAQKARAAFVQRFTLPSGALADCLRAESPATSAHHAVPEDAIRPNQLFAITLGILTDPAQTLPILRATQQLLIPGAIRSLADAPVNTPLPVYRDNRLLNDPDHPFWPVYAGDEDTSRKPAYHNGTAWVWPFPSYIEALLLVHGPAARPTARALLASASLLFNDYCVGHLPEILDAAAPHTQRGCPAQAWSISELLRVELLTR